ncbi:MAG: sulfatase [Holophagales bacterium]|nr:sulfatase [Holophagales bacterium]MYF94193.1 sulfatase [Holophagales bacterium]
MHRFPVAASLIALSVLVAAPAPAQDRPPNILFIAVDDLNDWVGHLAGHPQASTPNIDRLARRGVSFTRAYATAPLCNPSRVSLLSGVLPSKSGVYGNGERFREKLPDAVTLMQHLKAHGYSTRGGGKIFHGTRAGDPDSWDEYYTSARPRGARHIGERQEHVPESAWAPWGPLDMDDSEMFDVKIVDWTIGELNKAHGKPFFLACGFTKPHLPWYVPRKYFDMHPLEAIELPATLDSDRDDLPAFGKKLATEVYAVSDSRNFSRHGEDHAMVLKHDQWHRAVQSYLATISFVDAHVGRLLDALDESEHAANTIVVLWGDHGWHLGQKQHWRKHALWEVATRTTLIISMPASTRRGATSPRPVSLIDLYPTLVELAGVPSRRGLDGQSLVPLLENPESEWPRPVLTTYGYGNHSVRTERWRYIEYHDGGQELYDHDTDPNEWTNLASVPEYAPVVDELAGFLPTTNVE